MDTAFSTPPPVRKSLLSPMGKRPLTDRKRQLFPNSSPDAREGSDELACSLSSSPSVYSPPLPSPVWLTPIKMSPNLKRTELNLSNPELYQLSSISVLNQNSPLRRSPRIKTNTPIRSPKHITNLGILTMLNSPGKDLNETNIVIDFTTPQSNVSISPNSKSNPLTIKPVSFYGNSASLLARNEANSVAGIKKIYRVSINSRIKTKLFADPKPKLPTKRKANSENMHRIKRRKEMFTGVGHSLRPDKQHRSSTDMNKFDSVEKSMAANVNNSKTPKEIPIRDRIYNALDISKMSHMKQKSRKASYYYPVLKFAKPERVVVEGESTTKRKIFKTTLKSSGRAYYDLEPQSSIVTKKRKLLDPGEDFLNASQLTDASDILDLIEDGRKLESEDKMIKEGVDDLILQLDDELENEDSFCNKENELNLSNLSISDVADVSSNDFPECYRSPSKRYQLPDSEETNMSPLKFYNSASKENCGQTPRQKLFPLFDKRSPALVDVTNNSAEKSNVSTSKKRYPMGDKQYQIDAGQKRFGATECATCGVVYQLGDPDDEAEHEKYHKNFRLFKHIGWINEKVVGQYGLDRIILVTSDNKMWWNKTMNVLKVVDEELGYTTEEDRVLAGLKVYLYITNKQIAGCLVATPISHAFKMLISENDIDICSEDSYPVKCGISRMWTHPVFRRQGIASRLVDTMRKSFFFGFFMTMDDFAFSAPTENGKHFAKKYTGRSDYLIYTGW